MGIRISPMKICHEAGRRRADHDARKQVAHQRGHPQTDGDEAEDHRQAEARCDGGDQAHVMGHSRLLPGSIPRSRRSAWSAVAVHPPDDGARGGGRRAAVRNVRSYAICVYCAESKPCSSSSRPSSATGRSSSTTRRSQFSRRLSWLTRKQVT